MKEEREEELEQHRELMGIVEHRDLMGIVELLGVVIRNQHRLGRMIKSLGGNVSNELQDLQSAEQEDAAATIAAIGKIEEELAQRGVDPAGVAAVTALVRQHAADLAAEVGKATPPQAPTADPASGAPV